MKQIKLMQGDNMKSLDLLPDNSIDSVVTDGPYGLSFMNKKWDYDVPSIDFWKKVYQKLKPGGHVLSFGGTRTYHRMVVNMEDAGFEIRDQIMWIYGSGFPKSHNIGKNIDKKNGDERKIIGRKIQRVDGTLRKVGATGAPFVDKDGKSFSKPTDGYIDIEEPGSETSKKWEGWGTALKPANEPICLARKPLSEKTIVDNVIKWGTGGINIDGCRIATDDELGRVNKTDTIDTDTEMKMGLKAGAINFGTEGRFPANIIFDESAAEMLDKQSGISQSKKRINPSTKKEGSLFSEVGFTNTGAGEYNDKGGASRFFFNAKNYGGREDFFIYKEKNIIIWNTKSLNTQEYKMEECIEVSDALRQARENILQKPELYGNNTMVKYLLNTISITKMKTHSIMTFSILNVYTKMNIGHFTLMIEEKQSHLLMEENILNVQIVNNQNALVSSIETNQEVLVPIVNYVLEEDLENGETIIENTIINTTENTEQSRFRYVAKVSKKERNLGLDGFDIEINIGTIKLLIYKRKEEIIWEKQDQKVKHQVDMEQSIQKVIEEYGSQKMEKEEWQWNTELFGNYIMDQFQKECKSIILMETNLTTIYQILNVFIQQSTKEYIAMLLKEKMDGIKFVEDVEKRNTKVYITSVKEDGLEVNVNNAQLIELLSLNIKENKCSHPTLKPINLMTYLCRLITPPGGIILDPFMGSGSTGISACLEGFRFVGMELDEDYFKIAEARVNNFEEYRKLLK